MFRLTRKLMMIAAAAAALGGTGGGAALAATSTSTAAAVSSVPRCNPRDLSASLHGAEVGRGYHVGFILTLTNTGQRSCTLYGYPGLGLQDQNHHTVPSHTFWGPTWFDPDPGRRLIVLSPGETAWRTRSGQVRWAWKRPAATGATGPPTHSRPSGPGRTSIVLGRPVNRPWWTRMGSPVGRTPWCSR